MRLKFVGQPLASDPTLGRILQESLATRPKHVWIAVAWVKASGLLRLASSIRDARAAGAHFEVLIGIDENGATREGLRLALELFDRTYIFHDPSNRTFHPKIYAIAYDDRAVLIVGSGNLTKGGLYTNYEGFLVAELTLGDADDDAVYDDAREYFERLRDSGPACRELDDDLFTELISKPSYGVGSEAKRRPRRSASGFKGVFGSPTEGLNTAPALPATTNSGIPEDVDAEDDDSGSNESGAGESDATKEEEAPGGSAGGTIPPAAVPRGASGSGTPPVPAAQFWKRLSNNDVSEGSSPGQIIIPIRNRPFFEPLTVTKDETATGGVRQSDRFFSVEFTDGAFAKTVPAARAILYEPAATHPRPNKELRFTFKDREVFERLSAGDFLEFTKDAAGDISVQRLPPGSRPTRFGP